MAEEIKKIYRIEVPGIDESTEKVRRLNEELSLQKAIKQEAQKVLMVNKSDVTEMERQNKIIAQSEIQIKKLTSEKRLANREADIMIKAAEKAAAAEINGANAAKLASGSYNQVYASYKQLVELYKNTAPTNPLFEQLKKDAIDAKKRVDDFNRSLSPDGTLVSEYKSGILNAFKSMGLDDVLKNQKAQMEKQFQALTQRNKELVVEYKKAGTQGVDAFQKIEKELQDNIVMQQRLQGNLSQLNNTLKGTGTIGSQITTGLNTGFKNLLNTGLAVTGIGIGLTGVMTVMRDSIAEFEEAELASKQLEATLDNLGKTDVFERLKAKSDRFAEEFKFIDNDELIESYRKFVDYGKLTEKQIDDLLPVIIDFAAKQRISIGEATSVMIRALEGNGRALKEYGINMKDAKNSTEALSIIMTNLKPRVEGAARAFGETTAGQMKIARVEIDNLKEDIGRKLEPVIRGFLSFISQGIEGLGTIFRNVTRFYSELFTGISVLAAATKDFLLLDFAGARQRIRTAQEEVIATKKRAESAREYAQLQKEVSSIVTDVNGKNLEEQERLLRSYIAMKDASKRAVEELEKSGTASKDEVRKANAQLYKDIQIVDEITKVIKASRDSSILGLGGSESKAQADEARRQKEKLAREKEQREKEEFQKKMFDIDNVLVIQQIDLQKKKQAGLIQSEEEYERLSFSMETAALEKKMDLIKVNGAEEINQRARIQLELLNKEMAFQEKQYSLRKAALEKLFEFEKANAEEQAAAVTNNPNSSQADKAAALLVLDNQLLSIQKNFNQQFDDLEKEFNKTSEKNSADRARAEQKIRQDINKDIIELNKENFAADLSSINEAYVSELAALALRLQEKVKAVLDNAKLTSSQKIDLINRAKIDSELESLDLEIASDKKRLEVYKKMLEDKAIAQADYDRFVEQLINKGTEREQKAADKSIEIERRKKEVIDALKQVAFEVVNDFLESTFQAQEQNIEKEKQSQIERIDLEEKQRLAQAQTAQERAAIEKEAEARRKDAERVAGERMKDQKLKELAILTSVAIIRALSSIDPPLNYIEAAGILLKAAIEKSNIQRQTFDEGGNISPLTMGGVFGGRSHKQGGNRYLLWGRPVETEAKEISVIRTKNADPNRVMTLTGTQKQIASALNVFGGGKPFAYGARGRMFEYGGMIGESLQAPANPRSFLIDTVGGSQVNFDRIEQMVDKTNQSINQLARQTNERIDKLQVVQNTRDVHKAITKMVRSDDISTI